MPIGSLIERLAGLAGKPAGRSGHGDHRTVVILQPYIPAYRVKFFQELIDRAGRVGIDICVAAGEAAGNQAKRGDSADAEFSTRLRQREFSVLGRRVAVRSFPAVARKADLIILEQARRNLDIYRLFMPRRLRRQPIALWGHGADHAGSKSRADSYVRTELTRRADWFFAYTPAGVESVYAQGVERGRATNVQNSTDTAELLAYLARLSKNAESGSPSNVANFTATYIGALDEGKRIELLLAAAGVVHKSLPKFKLVIAGSGPGRDAVQHAAREHSWVEYVGTATGVMKAEVLAASELLMIPGSVGLVAVDALAAGRPIVTTGQNNHGPEFDYLTPGRTTIVTDPYVNAYANAVINLFEDRSRLIGMQQECRMDASGLSVEIMAGNFLAGIQSFFNSRDSS